MLAFPERREFLVKVADAKVSGRGRKYKWLFLQTKALLLTDQVVTEAQGPSRALVNRKVLRVVALAVNVECVWCCLMNPKSSTKNE